MTILLYAEHTTRAGQVCHDPDMADSHDVIEYTGDRDQLIADARERTAKRYDTRPGGSGDAFAWKCCRSILAELDAE